jgi:hypothetical protein
MAQQVSLDFRKAVKQYMKLTLIDGKEIEICKPSKAIFNMFKPLSESFNELSSEDLSETDSWNLLDTIYEICSKIMSHNRKREEISIEYLENTLDIDDLKLFFESYMAFVNDHLETAKN